MAEEYNREAPERIKELEIKLHQAMGALGHPVPGGLPESDLKCFFCEYKEERIDLLDVEVSTLRNIIDRFISKLTER